MSKHTPGPWQAQLALNPHADHVIYDASGNTVAEVNAAAQDFSELDPSVRNISIEESRANAFLIAAAPDLLEASRNAYEAMTGNNDPFDSRVWEDACDGLFAAIAKAQGGSDV